MQAKNPPMAGPPWPFQADLRQGSPEYELSTYHTLLLTGTQPSPCLRCASEEELC